MKAFSVGIDRRPAANENESRRVAAIGFIHPFPAFICFVFSPPPPPYFHFIFFYFLLFETIFVSAADVHSSATAAERAIKVRIAFNLGIGQFSFLFCFNESCHFFNSLFFVFFFLTDTYIYIYIRFLGCFLLLPVSLKGIKCPACRLFFFLFFCSPLQQKEIKWDRIFFFCVGQNKNRWNQMI